jgi:hypothetical protein
MAPKEISVKVTLEDAVLLAAEAMLSQASTDICEWLQLARRQYDEMPHNSPLCPTTAGIQKSERVVRELAAVSVAIRKLQE